MADKKAEEKASQSEGTSAQSPGTNAAVPSSGSGSSSEAQEIEALEAQLAKMPEEMSPEDIDELLKSEDPEFLNSLSNIAGDKSLSFFDASLSEEDNAIAEERQAWKSSKGIKRLVYGIFPFAPVLSYRFKKLKFRMAAMFHSVRVRVKNFIYFLATDGKDKTIGALKKEIKIRLDNFSKVRREFAYLPWRVKSIFFLIVFGFIGTGFFIYKSYTKGILPKENKLFLSSLDSVADEIYDFDPAKEVEPFYDNLRASSNLILLPKMVVNILKSKGSGENPMGAFEFFVEGMVPEVVVEIKDREVEIRDAMHRTLEEFNYDELESPDGKQVMQEKLVRRLNQMLSTGKARRVFIKNMVLKP